MGLYDKVLADVIIKKERREKGEFNGIPYCFPRYYPYFDTFNKGEYTGILGNTGSGKSRLLRFWMYHMVNFIMENDYPSKILYFSLEDPEIPVGKSIMSHYLYTRQGLAITAKMLNSSDKPLKDDYIKAIKNDSKFFREFDSIVEVINDLSTPNEIYNKVAQTFKEIGDTHHIIVLIDNQSNITRDSQDPTEWDAIKRLSRDIVRLKFCKAGITTITVLQVNADQEKNTFRNAGKGSLTNIEPNLSSIGDATVVAKTMHNIFALFDPNRFEIKEYPFAGQYNIDVLRGNFRSLLHLKSNTSEIAPRFGMLFSGAFEVFEAMPLPDDTESLRKIYAKIMDAEREKRVRAGAQTNMF